MDHLDRIHQAVSKEKILEKYILGKISTKEMEERVRKLGTKLKKKRRL